MGFYLVIFKKSLSTKNQDIKYNHLITNILQIPIPHLSHSKVKKRRVPQPNRFSLKEKFLATY